MEEPERAPHHVIKSVDEPEVPWSCMRRGGCYHYVTRMNSDSVGRFHCAKCKYDICEFCFSSEVKVPLLLRVPKSYLPMPGMMEGFFSTLEMPAHNCRILL